MQDKGCPLMASTGHPGCGERCGWFNELRGCCSILAISEDLEDLKDNVEDLLRALPTKED